MKPSRMLWLLTLILALLLPAFSQDAQPAKVAGSWQLSWQGRRGAQQGTLDLQQDGSKLTGTFQGPRGSSPLSGNVQGNQISFTVQMGGERRNFSMAFTGNVDGDKMSGSITGGLGGHGGGQDGEHENHSWSATRQQGGANHSRGNPDDGEQEGF